VSGEVLFPSCLWFQGFEKGWGGWRGITVSAPPAAVAAAAVCSLEK